MRPDNYIHAAQAYLVASARSRRTDLSESDQPRSFLTLSRQAGAGAHSVGERLVEILNGHQPDVPWTLFDDNLVHEVLREHDLPKDLARYMSEERAAEATDFMEVALGLHPPVDGLVRKMKATIIALARIGHVVLVGRGSHILTRGLPGGVHVRLVATAETRQANLARLFGLESREAAARMNALDAGRRAWVKRHCGEDIDDPLSYDAVINTTAQSIDAIASMLDRRLLVAGGGRVVLSG
jgi:cytidylate kinase